MARWLAGERIDALYASPLRRALETAEPLARVTGHEIRVEEGVIEFDHDSDVYVPLEEIKANEPERWLEMVQGGIYADIDLAGFRSLLKDALERIIAAHPGERVAVVCHGGVINNWAGYVLGIDDPAFFNPGYTSVNRFLAASSGERSVLSLNEQGHLR